MMNNFSDAIQESNLFADEEKQRAKGIAITVAISANLMKICHNKEGKTSYISLLL